MSAPALKFKPIALAVAFAFPTFAFAAAGRIDFAVGDVKALAPDGRTRPLAKGDEFDSGDTITTGDGRVWLRFTDGAQVSLQPQSQYRIDNYRFNGQADGEERGFFNLLKGGLRTITGWVGRTNRKNYQVTTAVATIGIRGTEFSIVYGNSITVSTGEGAVEICNSAGCLTLSAGESGYVANQDTKPVLVTAKADLPPPPTLPDPTFSVANNTNSSGGAAILGGINSSLVGVFNPGTTFTVDGAASFAGSALNNITLDATHFAANTGTITNAGGDGVISWGHWSTGNWANGAAVQPLTDVHYIVGVRTPSADLVGTVNFPTLVGATTPTVVGAAPIGTVTSGSLTAIFTGGTPQVSFSLNYSGGYSISGTGTPNLANASFSGTTNCVAGCPSGGTGTFTGIVVGTNAARAGLSYSASDVVTGTTWWGAAGFSR
jgi:hypothetical protein